MHVAVIYFGVNANTELDTIPRRTVASSDDEDELLILVLLLRGVLQGVDKLATIGIFVPTRVIVSRLIGVTGA